MCDNTRIKHLQLAYKGEMSHQTRPNTLHNGYSVHKIELMAYYTDTLSCILSWCKFTDKFIGFCRYERIFLSKDGDNDL